MLGTRCHGEGCPNSLETPLSTCCLCLLSVPLPVPYKEQLLLLLLSRFSRVRLCATPWTAAYQTPPSMGFSRQEYWSGLPLPSPKEQRSRGKVC